MTETASDSLSNSDSNTRKRLHHLVIFHAWITGLDAYGAVRGGSRRYHSLPYLNRSYPDEKPASISKEYDDTLELFGSKNVSTAAYLHEVAQHAFWSQMVSCLFAVSPSSLPLLIREILTFCVSTGEKGGSCSQTLVIKTIQTLLKAFLKPGLPEEIIFPFYDFFTDCVDKDKETKSFDAKEIYTQACISICENVFTICEISYSLDQMKFKVCMAFRSIAINIISTFLDSLDEVGNINFRAVSLLTAVSPILESLEMISPQAYKKLQIINENDELSQVPKRKFSRNQLPIANARISIFEDTQLKPSEFSIKSLVNLLKEMDEESLITWTQNNNQNRMVSVIRYLYFKQEYTYLFSHFLSFTIQEACLNREMFYYALHVWTANRPLPLVTEKREVYVMNINRILNRISLSGNNNTIMNANKLEMSIETLEQLKRLCVLCPCTLMDTILFHALERQGNALFLVRVLTSIHGFAQLPYLSKDDETMNTVLVGRLRVLFQTTSKPADLSLLQNIADFVFHLLCDYTLPTLLSAPCLTRSEIYTHCVKNLIRSYRVAPNSGNFNALAFVLKTFHVLIPTIPLNASDKFDHDMLMEYSWELFYELAWCLNMILHMRENEIRSIMYDLCRDCSAKLIESFNYCRDISLEHNKTENEIKLEIQEISNSTEWNWEVVVTLLSWLIETKFIILSKTEAIPFFWNGLPPKVSGLQKLNRLIIFSGINDALLRFSLEELASLQIADKRRARVEVVMVLMNSLYNRRVDEIVRMCSAFLPVLFENEQLCISFESELVQFDKFSLHDLCIVKTLHLITRALIYCHREACPDKSSKEHIGRNRAASTALSAVMKAFSDTRKTDNTCVLLLQAECVRLILMLLWLPELETSGGVLFACCLEHISKLHRLMNDNLIKTQIRRDTESILISYARNVTNSSQRTALIQHLKSSPNNDTMI